MAATPKKKPEPASKEDVKEASDAVVALREELLGARAALQAHTDSSLQLAREELAASLDAAAARLEASIGEAGAAAERARAAAAELAPQLEELRRAQADLEASLQRGRAEARQQAERGGRELAALATGTQRDLGAVREELRARAAETLAGARAHAEDRAAAVASGAPTHAQLQERLGELEARLREHCEGGLAALGARLDGELAAQAHQHRGALDALAGALRGEASAQDAAARQALRGEAARLEAAQAASAAVQAARLVRAEGELGRCFGGLERLEEQLGHTDNHVHAVRGDAEQQLAAAQHENTERLRCLERRVGRLREYDSSGIPTRQVEWRVEPRAVRDLQASAAEGAEPRGLFSPPFQLCGLRGLRLELRPLGSQAPHGAEGGRGDCSVYLWAPAGLELVFRVSAGGESAVLRREPGGEEPCGARGLFSLAEQASGEAEPLRVTVEVHEVTVDKALGGAGAGAGEGAAESDGEPGEGSLTLQRHVNHRLLDVVQSNHRGLSEFVHRKVDAVRSRAIRRVQWRLDQAGMLRQCFGEGRPICSTAFQAAGLTGMQLVFYPSGCSGAKEGFCSLFVSCPAGCTLRCWLWAGRWRREARLEPAERHDLLGRVNFCRWEACVDPLDESVELALEIEEAQQLVPGAPAPQPEAVPRAGASAGGASAAPRAPEPQPEAAAPPPAPLERTDVGALRLQQSRPGSRHPSQDRAHEHVQQLPAIWTSHGFRTFTELRGEAARFSRPPTSARGASRTVTCESLLLPQAGLGSPPGAGKPVPRLFADTARMPAVPQGHRYREYLPP